MDVKLPIYLEEFFKKLALLSGMSDLQKQEILTKLEGAIVLNILGKVLDELQESEREAIKQKEFKNSEDLFKFLSGVVSRENFQKIASSSVEEIVKKFLEKNKD